MNEPLSTLFFSLKAALQQLSAIIQIRSMPNSERMYNTAKSLLGQIRGADDAADGYGAFACAESVNHVARVALGTSIGGGASTAAMYTVLTTSNRFQEITQPLPGDIVISPTGTSTINPAWHGHVGICGEYGILSNNSEDGVFSENYTQETWEKSFAARGFPTFYFRVL
jgi:hypothetical protein